MRSEPGAIDASRILAQEHLKSRSEPLVPPRGNARGEHFIP